MADVTLSYKGSDILELSDSGSATLKTGGKYCEDDIEVEYVKPSGGGDPPYVDVTIVSGVSGASVEPILNALLAGSGYTSIYCKNTGTPPSSGYWLYGGIYFSNETGALGANYRLAKIVRRPSTNNTVSISQWTANGTVDSGTVFRVWKLYDYEAIYHE